MLFVCVRCGKKQTIKIFVKKKRTFWGTNQLRDAHMSFLSTGGRLKASTVNGVLKNIVREGRPRPLLSQSRPVFSEPVFKVIISARRKDVVNETLWGYHNLIIN